MTTMTLPINMAGATLPGEIETTRVDGSRATGLRLRNTISNLLFYLDCDQAGPVSIYSAFGADHPVRSASPTRDVTNKKFGASSFLWATQTNIESVVFPGMSIHPGGEGTVSMWVRPAYSGTPSNSRTLFDIDVIDAPDTSGRIHVWHQFDGTIQAYVQQNTAEGGSFGTWSPVAGTWYHIEVAWSDTNNRLRVFIDGVLLGTLSTVNTYVNPGAGCLFVIGAWFDAGGRVWSGNIDEIAIYGVELHTTNFAVPTAAIKPYADTLPVATLAPVDSGQGSSTWDMSTIDVFENFEGTILGSIKYKYKATNTLGGGTYNTNWLTLTQLQAEVDPAGRYLYLQVQFISDGHQRASIGDGTVSMTLLAGAVPTAQLSGRVTDVLATAVQFTLDSFPSSNLDSWRVAYRPLSHDSSILDWSFTTATSTPAAGQTINVTGLTESTTYQFALQGMNGGSTGNMGEIFTVTPSSKANTWMGTEVTEKIMSLVDDNLAPSTRLNIKRVAQYGTLEDYPPTKIKTANFPMVLVALEDVEYDWQAFPRRYKADYHFRIVYVCPFKTTDAVYKERVDALGQLAALFIDNRQLGFNAGTTAEGKVAYVLPTRSEVKTPEDVILAQHGNVYAVAVTLLVKTAANA